MKFRELVEIVEQEDEGFKRDEDRGRVNKLVRIILKTEAGLSVSELGELLKRYE